MGRVSAERTNLFLPMPSSWRSLAPRVLVYPGLAELSKHATPAALGDALDRAWLVLTTYRVLKKEVLYHGGGGGGGGEGGDMGSPSSASPFAFRREKRYAVPSSPLLLRRFRRLVIDEAQAVQVCVAIPLMSSSYALPSH